ncbi:MAG: hypothetical protein JWL95_2270 [Gemmatimonadetes bacterium]|nr:hypothetical protein [Gemmatimonadota bacterium]
MTSSRLRACLVRAGALLAMTSIVVAPSTASAQQSAEDLAAARQLGTDGVMLADEGKCAEAIEKLTRAEKLHHAPSTADRLGECQIELGMLVAGTELLQRVVREPLGPNPAPVFTQAVARAQKALQAALPKIGNLRVVVSPPAVKATLAIDGAPLQESLIGVDRPTDPGSHVVSASAAGYLPAKVDVVLAQGETKNVELTLVVDPDAPKEAPPPPVAGPSAPVAPPEEPSTGGSRAPAFAAFGVGAVGVVIGAVAGGLALSNLSSAESDCGADHKCRAGSAGASDLSTARSMATVSTVGFIVGGVGLATGAVLLLTRSSGSPSSTTSAASRPPPSAPRPAHVEPVLGLGSIGLRGTF